jgi:hypothetical protein
MSNGNYAAPPPPLTDWEKTRQGFDAAHDETMRNYAAARSSWALVPVVILAAFAFDALRRK